MIIDIKKVSEIYYNGDNVKTVYANNNKVWSKVTNLLLPPYISGTSKIINGVTFVVNDDGSITVNGTASANATFNLANINFDADKKYLMTSGIDYDGYQKLALIVQSYLVWGSNNLTTKGQVKITPLNNARIQVVFTVYKGYTVDNVTVYPKLLEV